MRRRIRGAHVVELRTRRVRCAACAAWFAPRARHHRLCAECHRWHRVGVAVDVLADVRGRRR